MQTGRGCKMTPLPALTNSLFAALGSPTLENFSKQQLRQPRRTKITGNCNISANKHTPPLDGIHTGYSFQVETSNFCTKEFASNLHQSSVGHVDSDTDDWHPNSKAILQCIDSIGHSYRRSAGSRDACPPTAITTSTLKRL